MTRRICVVSVVCVVHLGLRGVVMRDSQRVQRQLSRLTEAFSGQWGRPEGVRSVVSVVCVVHRGYRVVAMRDSQRLQRQLSRLTGAFLGLWERPEGVCSVAHLGIQDLHPFVPGFGILGVYPLKRTTLTTLTTLHPYAILHPVIRRASSSTSSGYPV